MSGGAVTEIGTGVDLIDRLVPLNLQMYYTAIDDVDSAVAGPITVASAKPVLSSTRSGAARQVVIVAQQPQSWSARSVWHPIIDRTDGPVVSIFPMEFRAGTMTLDLADRDERNDLLGMLRPGDPLILRSICPDRVDELTFLALEVSDPYVTDGAWSSGQRLEIRYQSVATEPAAYAPPPEWSYQAALAAHTSYTEWLTTYATYDDLLAKVPA